MTRLFLDTNVVLDLLAERIPFYNSIAKLATLADQKKITMITSTISFTTVYYVLNKFESHESVLNKLIKFKIICEICEVNGETIEKGLSSNFQYLEDSLQYFSAIQSNCSIIITRNSKDFKSSNIPIMTAEEYFSSIH